MMYLFVAIALIGLVHGQGLSFVDQTAFLGGAVRTGLQSLYLPLTVPTTSSAIWFDYDMDNDLDLFAPGKFGQIPFLWRNDAGNFTNVAATAGFAGVLSGSSASVAGDLDNDGFPDLIVTGEGAAVGVIGGPVRVWHNNGDGTFSEVSSRAGIHTVMSWGSVSLFDADADGLVDVYIAGAGHVDASVLFNLTAETLGANAVFPNYFFHNLGNMTFEDISESSGVRNVNMSGGACAAVASDFDNDGDTDIISTDCILPGPVFLMVNQGDLTFVPTDLGLVPGFYMSASPGDIDRDGDMDIYISNFGGPGFEQRLLLNNGDGTFTDTAGTAFPNVTALSFSWSGAMADYNNDGFLDLGISTNSLVFSANAPGYLFRNTGAAGGVVFAEEVPPFNFTDFDCHALVQGDYDGDGDVDLASACDFGPFGLYENTLNATNTWIAFRLTGTTSNAGAIGARVELVACGVTQLQEVYAGSNIWSAISPWPHFGLGACTEQANVTVTWPSGDVEQFGAFDTNQYVALVEGDGLAPTESNSVGDDQLSVGAQVGIIIAVIFGTCLLLILCGTASYALSFVKKRYGEKLAEE